MKKYMKNIVIGIFYVVIWVCIFTVIFYALQSEDTNEGDFDYVSRWDSGWILETQGGEETSIKIPTDTISSNVYTIKSILPRNISESDALFLWVDNQEVTVYIDGKSYYSYSGLNEKHINKNLSPAEFIVVPLGSQYSGKDIRIQYRNKEFASSKVDEIFLGDQTSVIFSLFRRNILVLIAGIVELIFGILSIFRFATNSALSSNLVKSYLYKGIAMVILAFWFFFQVRSRQFFINNIFFVRDMNYIVQLLIPIPFIYAVIYTEEKKYIRAAHIFTMFDLINDVFFFILLFSGAANIKQLNIMVDIPMDASVVFCAITVLLIILKDKKLFNKIKLTIVLLLFLAFSGIAEILIFYATGIQGIALPIGVMLFTVVTEIQNSLDLMKSVRKDIEFNSYKKSQKTFLASVSHEIRTPINSVLGLDEMILRETNEAKTRDYALDIKTSGELLLSLVNDILEFSKMESGILRILPENYSLRALLEEVCTVIKTKALAKNLDFIVKVNPETPDSLNGDNARIRQVLINLLNNAVKYTKTGSVTLTVDFDNKTDDSVRILYHVIDTGMGIKEQDINKVFMPFVRVDEEKNKKIEGTGLGMSITENLLELMGSRISLVSKYGKGSDFSCRIVQKVTDEKQIGEFNALDVSVIKAEDNDTIYCPKAEILVVDDTPLNIKVFTGLMKETDANIESAQDGYEAVEKSKKTKYDIIFMDQKMPGMDGPSAMHEIKDNTDCAKNHDTPIILLTANAVPGIYEEAITEGFNDYLSKPINPKALRKILRKHLPEEKIETKLDVNAAGNASAANVQREDSEEENIDPVSELLSALASECGLEVEDAVKNMGDKDLYISIVTEFASSGGKNADEIEALKNSQDIENYTIKVHALKSSARIIGAKILSSEAKDLEELGDIVQHTGSTESLARIEMSTEKMLSDYRSLSESINDVLKINGKNVLSSERTDEEKENLPEIPERDLKEAYSIIGEMTESFDINGIKTILDNLKQYKLKAEDEEKIKSIAQCASEFNYEGIRKALGNQ